MKKLKIYRVINDTRKSHGMVNNYAKLDGEASNDHLWLKETKTGVYFLCLKSDVVEATAEYITKKLELRIRCSNYILPVSSWFADDAACKWCCS